MVSCYQGYLGACYLPRALRPGVYNRIVKRMSKYLTLSQVRSSSIWVEFRGKAQTMLDHFEVWKTTVDFTICLIHNSYEDMRSPTGSLGGEILGGAGTGGLMNELVWVLVAWYCGFLAEQRKKRRPFFRLPTCLVT